MVFKAVTGADQKAFDIYNSADTFNEIVIDALDVTNKHPNDYKNRIVLNWGDFSPSEVIKYIWVIDQSCSVKMAGYWPSSFFACLWTETKSRSINTQKRTRPISSHLDRTSLVNKGFIIWLLLRGNFSCGTQRVIPSGQDSSILPALVANHSAGFGSSCPLTELAI